MSLFGVVLVLHRTDQLGLKFMEYCCMTVLSALLIHYVLDGYLFAVSNRADEREVATPYAGSGATG